MLFMIILSLKVHNFHQTLELPSNAHFPLHPSNHLVSRIAQRK